MFCLRITATLIILLHLFCFSYRGQGLAQHHVIATRSRLAKLHSVESSTQIERGNINTERKSFKRFVQVELWKQPDLESLYPILCSIETACRDINRLMRRISTDDLQGLHADIDGIGSINIQGEGQKKLDVIANRIMKNAVCCSKKVSMVVSEEDDEPSLCSTVTDNSAFSGEYAVVFDPLDGSSNVDCGLPAGTIFGIHRNPKYGPIDPLSTISQRGSELLVAGYCLYSAATHIVITLRNGLHIFTMDDVTGEFYLTRSNVRIPRSGSIYSFNDAYSSTWHPAVSSFLSDFKTNRVPGVYNKAPSARYMGALVADTHNILMNGGVFGYPGSPARPQGKLRLLYEANPLALIVEAAGGLATNGLDRILDLPISNVHQRTPLFLGSADQVSALQEYMSRYNADESSPEPMPTTNFVD